MPADRTLAEDLAGDLTDLYTSVETRLAADIARRLAAGLDRPDWAERKLAQTTRLRRWAENLTRRLDSRVGDQVAQTLTLAYMRGGDAAMREMATLQSTHAEWLDLAGANSVSERLRDQVRTRQGLLSADLANIRAALPGIDAVQRLQFSLTSRLRGTHLRITRWAEDAYREVVGRTASDVLLGIATRRQAAQTAWARLMEQGVTGFVDRSGRRWNLATYVEMSTRTHTAQAAVEGHLDRLGAAGLDLVIVSDAPQECSRCRPWEGKVLTQRGADGRTEHRHAITGEPVSVEVAGSVDDAVRAGLLHPNCRHSLSAYLPGVTRRPTNTADPQGDADRQHLRKLERQVRRDKLQAAGALTEQAKTAAQAKVRAGQAAIRAHVANSTVFRQPPREQINLGHSLPGLRPTRPTNPPPSPPPPPLPRRVRPTTPRPPENLTDTLDMDFDSAAVRDVVNDMLAQVVDGTYAGLTVELNGVDPYLDFGLGNSSGFLARMSIFEDIGDVPSGKLIGNAVRGFYRDNLGDLVVVHALLELHRDVRGRGFATEWNAHLEQWYRQQGVTRIELHADIDVGGYTWASHGYDFADQESAIDILARLERHTDEMEKKLSSFLARVAEGADATVMETANVMEAQIGEARAILERAEATGFGADGYPSAWEISQVGRHAAGGDQWLGKTTMLGSAWLGVKWL